MTRFPACWALAQRFLLPALAEVCFVFCFSCVFPFMPPPRVLWRSAVSTSLPTDEPAPTYPVGEPVAQQPRVNARRCLICPDESSLCRGNLPPHVVTIISVNTFGDNGGQLSNCELSNWTKRNKTRRNTWVCFFSSSQRWTCQKANPLILFDQCPPLPLQSCSHLASF